MTVRELIEKLRELPDECQGMPVAMYVGGKTDEVTQIRPGGVMLVGERDVRTKDCVLLK